MDDRELRLFRFRWQLFGLRIFMVDGLEGAFGQVEWIREIGVFGRNCVGACSKIICVV